MNDIEYFPPQSFIYMTLKIEHMATRVKLTEQGCLGTWVRCYHVKIREYIFTQIAI